MVKDESSMHALLMLTLGVDLQITVTRRMVKPVPIVMNVSQRPALPEMRICQIEKGLRRSMTNTSRLGTGNNSAVQIIISITRFSCLEACQCASADSHMLSDKLQLYM